MQEKEYNDILSLNGENSETEAGGKKGNKSSMSTFSPQRFKVPERTSYRKNEMYQDLHS